MKNLEIKKGNVLDSNFEVIAHQVNCRGVMGAGVAKAIKQKYPEVYEQYAEYCEEYEDEKDELFGSCLVADTQDGYHLIANLFGQKDYGTHNTQTDYKKLYSALLELKDYMIENHVNTLSFPYMIGCGLAGGDEQIVEKLIREVFDETNIIYNFYDINS